MLALPASLVLVIAFTLASAQSSFPASNTSHNPSSSAPGPISAGSSVSGSSLTTVTVTGANGSSSVIPITVSPTSSNASATSSAPFPTLTGYSPCVINCFNNAVANANCSSVTDVNCFCSNRTFPSNVSSCITSNCVTDLPNAQTLADSFCALASTSTSFSFTSPTSLVTFPTSSSQPTTSAAPSQTSSDAQSGSANSASAMHPWNSGWGGERAALGVSVVGAMIGALLL